MRFNTCCTARSFESPQWMHVYREFHRGLRAPEVTVESGVLPSVFQWYSETLWRDRAEAIGREWCGPQNVGRTHKIWEYVQVLGCLYYSMPALQGRRVLSLGAGIESPLWTLARWGADVTATDIYDERRYWHPEHVSTLRADSARFSPYLDAAPVTFRNLNLKRSNVRSVLAWRRLGMWDAVYSISSLEHVYGVQRRGAARSSRRIFARKLALFRRIAALVKPGGVLAFTTELITRTTGDRRLDFYTREELEAVITELGGEGLCLVDEVDWSAMAEQERPTRDTPGQHHTAVALAFTKAVPRSGTISSIAGNGGPA